MASNTPRQSVDSHSSYLTNQRIANLLTAVDSAALSVSSRMHLQTVVHYYSCVEQLYINVSDIIPPKTRENIKVLRENYNRVLAMINTDPRARTRKAITYMHQVTKDFNYRVVHGLQENSYFFRLSNKVNKGLGDVSFFTDSLFGSGESGDNENEEQTEED